MIIFKKIKWKNFLSTGTQFLEIELNKCETTGIFGKNSHGKSTALDAITFVLFNKPYRPINLPQLINSVNGKDSVVEIEFTIGTNDWRIRRGQKPAIFEIYKNDEFLDQSHSTKEQQAWLEKNVLRMNYKTFTQVVILGTSNYIPFMQLPPASRREIIEDLLDIKIFSSMNVVVKEKVKTLKTELQNLEYIKKSLDDKVEMQKNFILDIEKQSQDTIKEKQNKIDETQCKIDLCNLDTKTLSGKITVLTEEMKQYSGVKNKVKQLEILKGKLSNKINTVKKEIAFFVDNHTCPTCTQPIEEDFRTTKISDTNQNLQEVEKGYLDLNELLKEEEKREAKLIEISDTIRNHNSSILQNNTKISSHHSLIKDLNTEIETIKSQLKNKGTEHNKLKQFIDDLDVAKEDYEKKKDELRYYEFSATLLKDGGVKTKIIKKYLPLINQQINRYLQAMNFYVHFILDEEFSETICTPVYENFSYNSFSQGQKQRIDLAITFAFMKVAEIKNSSHVNINIYDEVLENSLDFEGVTDFLKIIKTEMKHKNIFIISHREGVEDKFDRVITFEKKGNFSHKKESLSKAA
jgi:DNA repair exonuclease SbcCD ATPase subunit